MYFPKHQLRKTWLDKRLKSRLSDDVWTENMENWSKPNMEIPPAKKMVR